MAFQFFAQSAKQIACNGLDVFTLLIAHSSPDGSSNSSADRFPVATLRSLNEGLHCAEEVGLEVVIEFGPLGIQPGNDSVDVACAAVNAIVRHLFALDLGGVYEFIHSIVDITEGTSDTVCKALNDVAANSFKPLRGRVNIKFILSGFLDSIGQLFGRVI